MGTYEREKEEKKGKKQKIGRREEDRRIAGLRAAN
jgi:hypothetical protein